jgi:hypothetical protein
MESLESTTNVLRKRAGSYLLLALLGTLPATSALAETTTVDGDLIVKGQACVGAACESDTFFPFDPLRIHGPEPVLSMVDGKNDWSIGITDDGMGGPTELFISDRFSGEQVLRMDVDGAVALGAGADLVPNAVSVGRGGSVENQRRVTHVADAEDATDAVNMRQFEAFQASALQSVGASAEELDQELQAINDRIDDLAERIDRLARKVQ